MLKTEEKEAYEYHTPTIESTGYVSLSTYFIDSGPTSFSYAHYPYDTQNACLNLRVGFRKIHIYSETSLKYAPKIRTAWWILGHLNLSTVDPSL